MTTFLLVCILLAIIAPELLGFLIGLAILAGLLFIAAVIVIAVFA